MVGQEGKGKGITVHETVPGGDGGSAGGFHRSTNNDEFLEGVKWLRWHSSVALQGSWVSWTYQRVIDRARGQGG